jgi:uncharacterized protein YidB (DUF937 family)
MGLFDAVVGALGASSAPAGQGNLMNVLIGLIGQAGGSSGGLGGLSGLVEKFTHAGLGEAVNSWVGTGQNLPISAEQLGGVLGSDTVAKLASQLGLHPNDAMSQLSTLLPQVVDKLTPGGHLPAGGAGMGDLGSLLGGLLGSR